MNNISQTFTAEELSFISELDVNYTVIDKTY